MSVVHCKKNKFDIYVGRGRGSLWGNPFSHKDDAAAAVRVGNRTEAVTRFRSWLNGESDTDLEQDRRLYILNNVHSLRGKILGCWCWPLMCHGEVLEEYSNLFSVPEFIRIVTSVAKEPTKIACIGKRKGISEEEGYLCLSLGEYLSKQPNLYIGTGNAEGCDNLYAQGGNLSNPSKVILYLPWKNFNKEFIQEGNLVRTPPYNRQAEFETLVLSHHPQASYLKQGAMKLHLRNCAILDNAAACVALPSKTTGGTKFGMAIAHNYNIPVLDISIPINKCLLLNYLKGIKND